MKKHDAFAFYLVLIFSSTLHTAHADDNETIEAQTSKDNIKPATILIKTCKKKSYPANSVRRGEEGKTLVKVLINTMGDAKEVTILKSSGFEKLDAETIKYFSNCKYSPAMENSIPVNVRQPFEYTWSLKNSRQTG